MSHDDVLLRFLGTELEVAEAELPLPAPPRTPCPKSVGIALYAPPDGASETPTIAPRKS